MRCALTIILPDGRAVTREAIGGYPDMPAEEDRVKGGDSDAFKRACVLFGIGEYLYGDEPTETYTELHSFYLLVDRPAVYGLPEAPFNPWLHMLGDYGRTIASALATVAAILAVLFLQGG